MKNRDVGFATYFGQQTSCPSLSADDPVVSRAAQSTDSFMATLNTVVWTVSRDASEELQMAAPHRSMLGKTQVNFMGSDQKGCLYHYYTTGQVGGVDVPQLKLIYLTKK